MMCGCGKILTDAEATAKFAGSGVYVDMCKKCRSFLPKDLKILTRPDLEKQDEENPDDFDLAEYEDEDDDWR